MSKGNGKLKGGNGKLPGGNGKLPKQKKKKSGPKGIPYTSIKKAAVRSGGSPTKMAKELGVTPATAHEHLQKPDIQKAVITARERAMKAAGISRIGVYKTYAEAMKANVTATFEGEVIESKVPDHHQRRLAARDMLAAFGDLKDTDQDKIPVIFNFYIPEKDPLPDIQKIDTIDA